LGNVGSSTEFRGISASAQIMFEEVTEFQNDSLIGMIHSPTKRLAFIVLLIMVLGPAASTSERPLFAHPNRSLVTTDTETLPATGAQKIVTILIEFPDSRHVVSVEEVRKQVFVDLNAYYSEASYNMAWIVGQTTSDWIMMPKPFLSYGNMGFGASWSQRQKLVQDAIHAADSEVDFREFVQVIIVVPRVDLIGYASDKWAAKTNDGVVVNRATVQREDRPPSLFAHEMGHSLGLRDMYDHELAAKLGSSDAAAIYVGPWDLMSMAFRGFIHFSSYNKIKLGWISPEHVRTVPSGEVATIVVDPIETSSDGTQTVKIPLAGSRYYLLEARSRIGFDKGLPDEGLLIMLIDETTHQDGFARVQDANPDTVTLDDATFDARTGKNPTFFDSRNDIAVMVLHSVSSGYKIHVTTAGKGQVALDAWKVLHEANNTIQEAQEEGRLLGLEEARSLLQKAVASFYDGDYEAAVNLSGQARVLAEKATKPTATTTATLTGTASSPSTSQGTAMTETRVMVTAAGQPTGGVFTVEAMVVLGVALAVILITVGVFYLRRRRK